MFPEACFFSLFLEASFFIFNKTPLKKCILLIPKPFSVFTHFSTGFAEKSVVQLSTLFYILTPLCLWNVWLFKLYMKSLFSLNLLAAYSLLTTKCCPYLYILWTAFVLPFYFLIVSLIHLNYLTRGRYWRVWSKKTSWFVFIFIRHVFVENLPSSRHYSKAVGKIILPICSLPSFGRRQTISIGTNKTGKGMGCDSGM